MYIYIYIYIHTYTYILQHSMSLASPRLADAAWACPPTLNIIISEFRDVVFEDVVFDNNRCYLILYLYFT